RRPRGRRARGPDRGLPRGEGEGARMITGEGIVKTFKQRGNMLAGREVRALRGVDFAVPKGGAASFIGESGGGKTTLGRIIARLARYDERALPLDGDRGPA